MYTQQDIFNNLKKLPFFIRLNNDVIQKLCNISSIESFNKDDVIIKEGDPGEALYIILSGQANVLKEINIEKQEYKSLGIMGEEEIFGEIALFDNQPRSATVTARTNLSLIKISREDFQKFLTQDTRSASIVLSEVITVLSTRLRINAQELVANYEVSRAIASSINEEDLITKVFRIVLQAIPPTDSAVFSLYNKFTEEIEIKDFRGFQPDELGDMSLSLKEPLIQILKETLQSYEGNPSKQDLIREGAFKKAQSVIVSPLFTSDKFFGFIALFNHHSESAFSLAQRNLLSSVCIQLSHALENAAFRREEDERKRLQRIRF